MNQSWYIDAIDARAGNTFASFRDSDLLQADSLEKLNEPVVQAYIAPPFFKPEFGVSRATSFAASRGASQLGFFIDNKEVSFSSLDSVIEFTRRVYLRGGGGDDSGPAIPEPNPENEGPSGNIELPVGELQNDQEDSIETFKKSYNDFHEFKRKIRAGEIESKLESNDDIDNKILKYENKVNANRIVKGAYSVLVELLCRYPSNSKNQEHLIWVESSRRFLKLVLRIGIFPDIVNCISNDEKFPYFLKRLLDKHVIRFPGSIIWDDLETRFRSALPGLLYFILLRGIDEVRELEHYPYIHYFEEHLYERFNFLLDSNNDNPNVLRDLSHLPIPIDIQNNYPIVITTPKQPSIREYLASFTACPHEHKVNERSFNLMLFAAASINATITNGNSGIHFEGRYLRSRSNFDDYALNKLAASAFKWLYASFPKYCYHENVESSICNANRLKYRK